ncbi:MAG: hypothetical protein RLO08_14315 [Parvibaculaceae bacterium]
MSAKPRCFAIGPYISTAEEGRMHHERRWTLDWWLIEHRKLKEAQAYLVRCFEELTPDQLEHPHFDEVWQEIQLEVFRHKDQLKWLEKWRDNLAPHDPYCYLATIH